MWECVLAFRWRGMPGGEVGRGGEEGFVSGLCVCVCGFGDVYEVGWNECDLSGVG